MTGHYRVGPPAEDIPGIWDLIDRMAACESTTDWSFLLNDYIQWGNNSKVDSSVGIFSLNAAHDCPNRWTENCQVDGDQCYAVVDETRYDYVKAYARRQEYLWDCLDADTFADAVIEIVDRKYNPVVAFKFSQHGDFRHNGDIIKVNRIAERLADIDISVFTYSASDYLAWSLAENVVVNQSNDRREYGNRRYRVVDSVSELSEDAIHCPYDRQKREKVPLDERVKCGVCRACILPDGPDVEVVA